MIYVVLIEPEMAENVGFTARAMKNFGLKELVLINPKCKLDKAVKTAKHAKDILKKAKIKKIDYLNKFDYLIGTTSKLGTDYNIPRSPLTASQLAEKINKKNKIAVLFGREGTGLTNKEILKCDFVVTIPASRKYSALNISHAASIIFYELFKRAKEKKSDFHIIAAKKKEKDILLKNINKILNKIKFSTKEKKETQKKVWKRVVGKAFLTKREAFALIGFFKKLK